MDADLHAARSARAAAMGAARAAEDATASNLPTVTSISTAAEPPAWPSTEPRQAWAARVFDPPRWALSLFALMNYYSWVGFSPGYETQVAKRDFRVQLLFTIATLPIVIWLVAENLIENLGRPVVTPETTGLYPDPEEIAKLFSAPGTSVASLSCPCTEQEVPLAQLANWTAPEDSFCTSLRASTDLFRPDLSQLNELANRLDDPTNTLCSSDRAGLRASLVTVVTSSGLIPNDANFAANIDVFANSIERSLCSLAFGLESPAAFGTTGLPPRISSLVNTCWEAQGSERQFLSPSAFQFSSTPANAVQILQSRMRIFLREALSTCEAIRLVREGFLRSVKETLFVAPLALSRRDLELSVDRQWRAALAAASAPTSSFVPGLSAQDTLSSYTDVFTRWNS
jgi:hypothetical protein